MSDAPHDLISDLELVDELRSRYNNSDDHDFRAVFDAFTAAIWEGRWVDAILRAITDERRLKESGHASLIGTVVYNGGYHGEHALYCVGDRVKGTAKGTAEVPRRPSFLGMKKVPCTFPVTGLVVYNTCLGRAELLSDEDISYDLDEIEDLTHDKPEGDE